MSQSIVLELVAKEWIVLLISRLASGCASGFVATAVVVYMSEISMPQFRGALLGCFSLSFALGQVFLAIGLKVLQDTKPMAFRNIFYSEFVFFGLWMIPMLYLPESPVFLCLKGRHEQAKKALRRLVGPVSGYDVEHEYAVLQQEVAQSVAMKASESDWKAMATKINVKRTIIATLPFTFQAFCGNSLIFGYTTYFFQLAQYDDPFLGNLIIQLILVIGIVLSFYTVDKVGRRTLVISGGAGLGLICFIVGGLGFLRQQTTASGAALVALCSIWAFVYANSMAPLGKSASWHRVQVLTIIKAGQA
jgi:MFS family permease